MFRKNYFTTLLLAALFLFGGIAVFAQTAKTIEGKIELKKSDGSSVPVKDAVIDITRIDTMGKLTEVKTNESGDFVISDFPASGVYAISISGAGIKPEIIPEIKAGMDKFVIPVSEGDGKRYSEEQVRLSTLTGLQESGKLSDEQKKMLKEYEDKKGNVGQKNAIISQALKEGNAAFESKNYAVAIAKYDEGINADPDFVGSAPVLLRNKAIALNVRAVNTYNDATKSGDAEKIKEAKKQAGKDLSDALEAFNKAYMILSKAPASEIPDQAKHKENLYSIANGGRDVVRIMSVIKIGDADKTEAAKNIVKAYLETETDKDNKGKAQASLASYLMDSNDYMGAITEYKKAAELAPNDADVLAGLSLALYTAAEDKQSKEMKQESLNYMEKYLKVAPKDHNLREELESLATYLKTEEKLKPQKIN